MATNFCYKELVKILSRQGNQLDRLYSQKANELAAILKRYNLKDQRNVWKGNMGLERQIDKILIGLDESVKAYMLNNIRSSMNLSNNCYDSLANKYLQGKDVPTDFKERMMGRNQQALDAFIATRQKELQLSSAVWNLDVQSKQQLEFFLKEGLAEGTSARELATDLKKFLKEPNRRFRRIRNDEGKLILSSPAKLYKPGPGVYRSSYANALRLARNEINIGYRESDHLRRKELDFIVGFKVNLSNAHPKYDICDELQGSYPKNFRFLGWHPNCLCFTTTILMSDKDFIKGVNQGNFDHARMVSKIPTRAFNHINEKADRIKGWKNKPYFIKDNFKNTKDGFDLKVDVTR